MSIVLRGGRVIDSGGESVVDVEIGDDGQIAAMGTGLAGEEDLDCAGCVVTPGLVYLHTHLRQPGDEEAETIETGARAAALGGYTAVVAMPNTEPATDCVAVVEQVRVLGQLAACEIVPSAAMTVGRRGHQMTPMGELVDAGVGMFTDDGTGVQDPQLMRHLMEYSTGLTGRLGRQVVLAQHCEVTALSQGGFMN